MLRPTLAVVLLLVATGLLRADVTVVSPDGTGDTTNAANALVAAAPGDTVIIRPGDYRAQWPIDIFPDSAEPLIIDSGIRVVGDVGGEVLLGATIIQGLPADECVVLSNVAFQDHSGAFSSQFIYYGPALRVTSCDGPVLIEGCVVIGPGGKQDEVGAGGPLFSTPGEDALVVTGSAQVAVSRSQIFGGSGFGGFGLLGEPDTTTGGDALVVEGSTVVVAHGTLTGGTGGSTLFGAVPGKPGGAGARVVGGSEARLHDLTITGGTGGNDCLAVDPDDCMGGTALVASDSLVRTQNVTFLGGAGGQLDDLTFAEEGVPSDLANVTTVALPGSSPRLDLPAVLRQGEAGTLTVTGVPNDLVGLAFGLESTFVPLAGTKGVLLVGMPLMITGLLVPIPGSGQLDLPVLGPPVPGVPGVFTIWQAYASPGGGYQLSNAAAVVLGDASL